MKAYNKWNKKTYEIIELSESEVTLKDSLSGRVFKIARSEFMFSYYQK